MEHEAAARPARTIGRLIVAVTLVVVARWWGQRPYPSGFWPGFGRWFLTLAASAVIMGLTFMVRPGRGTGRLAWALVIAAAVLAANRHPLVWAIVIGLVAFLHLMQPDRPGSTVGP